MAAMVKAKSSRGDPYLANLQRIEQIIQAALANKNPLSR